MKIKARALRAIALSGLTACALLIGATSALATTVTPAGHTLRIDPHPIYMQLSGSFSNCTINGGSAAIPAAPGNYSAGVLTIPLSVRPSFTACSGGVTVSTSGSWTLKLNNGTPKTATITAPSLGMTYSSPTTGCSAANNTPFTISGTWNNGAFVPFANSNITNVAFSSIPVTAWGNSPYLCQGPMYVNVGSTPFTVSNLTTPTTPIMIAP